MTLKSKNTIELVEEVDLNPLLVKISNLVDILSKNDNKSSDEFNKYIKTSLLDISKNLFIFVKSQSELNNNVELLNTNINKVLELSRTSDNNILDLLKKNYELLIKSKKKSWRFEVHRDENGISRIDATNNL